VGHTSQYWANSLVKELIATSEKPDQSNVTDVLDIDKLKASYKAAKSRVMFFDYDVRKCVSSMTSVSTCLSFTN
jgi:trehalose 6-phosphate synthase/phosphatase